MYELILKYAEEDYRKQNPNNKNSRCFWYWIVSNIYLCDLCMFLTFKLLLNGSILYLFSFMLLFKPIGCVFGFNFFPFVIWWCYVASVTVWLKMILLWKTLKEIPYNSVGDQMFLYPPKSTVANFVFLFVFQLNDN